MAPTQLKISYVGRDDANRTQLLRLLRQAGYTVKSTGRQLVVKGAGDGAPRGKNGRAPVMNLRALRESVGRTQNEIARKASISQSQLSRVEARRDHLISTLRRYVEGLGGTIEVTAVIDGARIALRDV
jgi:hypothetical protein